MNYCHIILFMEENFSIRKIVAKNVKKYRKLNNLTQENLAEAANISNNNIGNGRLNVVCSIENTIDLEDIVVELYTFEGGKVLSQEKRGLVEITAEGKDYFIFAFGSDRSEEDTIGLKADFYFNGQLINNDQA